MLRLGGSLLALVSLLAAACTAAPPVSKDPIARAMADLATPGAALHDEDFEWFLAGLVRAKAFGANADAALDGIRASRAGAASQLKPSTTRPATPRLAALSAATFQVLMPGYFAELLAMSLDPETKPVRDHTREASSVKTYTETGPSVTTVTTLTDATVVTIVSSLVQLKLHWKLTTVQIENATLATLAEVTDDRAMTGSIDVCPDASGVVPSTLAVQISLTGKTPGRTHIRNVTRNSKFTGTVNDSARLTRVHQDFTDQSSWEGDINGGVDASASIDWTPNGSLGDLNQTSYSSNRTTHGDVPDGLDNVLVWAQLLDKYAVSKPYDSAQELWRHGRCVMVTAPDYHAETPVDVEAQGKIQHDETVDPGSETKFKVDLKHRFAGALRQPIDATFDGQKTLEPRRLEGPGQLTYKAPDEQDKKATVGLTSMSKRGIGTLYLDFHTGGEGLTLTISGTLKLRRSFIGTLVEVTDTVQIGPVEFKKAFGDMWEGTGTWSAQTSSFTSVPGRTERCTGTQSGTITMLATHDTTGPNKVWVIEPLDGNTTGTATTSCKGEIIVAADAADQFLGTFRAFTIREEGGVQAIHGTQGNSAIGEISGEGTLNAKTKSAGAGSR